MLYFLLEIGHAERVTQMQYLTFIEKLHEKLRPNFYFEIGVRDGKSLSKSKCRSIGVDPAFVVTEEIDCHVSLFRQTSDEFFIKRNATDILGAQGKGIDLVFIDGMHLSDFVWRDFVNSVEHCADGAWVIFDDIVPQSFEITTREQLSGPWTGDCYKVPRYLKSAGLEIRTVDTRPSGLSLLQVNEKVRTFVRGSQPDTEMLLESSDLEFSNLNELRSFFQVERPEEFLESVIG